jgi:radical SAM superfamily enzyme YgiQ (UPF0313 family)
MANNILLINPEINPKTQKKFITDIIRASFPFSLGHLAGYLLSKGIGVTVVDDQLSFLEEENLGQFLFIMDEPKIVGLSTLTATSARVYELADQIKQIAPEATVILGGVHASVLPEEALSHQSVDIVVRSEGELILTEIVDTILNDRDFRHTQGISFRQNGNYVHNHDMPLLEDLNRLPPFPYHLFESDMAKYPGFASIQTSRGCPYGCIFCSQRSISGRRYRYVNPKRAIHDIQLLTGKYGATTIRIMDDNIGANKKHFNSLLDAIIKNGLHKKASFEAPIRGDNLDEEMVDKLKEANFSLITFGLETTNETLMKEIQKGETVQQVMQAIKMTAQRNIAVGTTLIFGLPHETNKDRWNAIKTVSSLPLSSVRFNTLTPYPGTPIYYELLEKNKLLIKKDWENFSVQYMWEGDDLPYVPDGTDKYELLFFTMFANLWFYLRPGGLWKIFTQSAAGGNVIVLRGKWYFTGFLFKIMRVGFYLTKRFIFVFGKMMVRKISEKLSPRQQTEKVE